MAYTQLTEIERYQISSLKEAGFTQRFIATSLNRNPSTISRELKRNQAVQKYCPQQAQLKASERRHSALKAVKVTPEILIQPKLLFVTTSVFPVIAYLRASHS
ncbi:helix-turn-helix domain-containing protein, partial [Xenorhabdus bovienii]|uniref:helix-turn-helix domain-containing protein n=2 Tax=Xenorhabdus bovienii TaxID=40576 RepID=UPI00056FF3A3